MKSNKNILLILFSSLIVIFGSFFIIYEYPKENSLFDKAYVWFRFHLSPQRHVYYHRYIKAHIEVYNDYDQKVDNVSINDKMIFRYSYRYFPRYTNLLLKPGNYTIKWRVSEYRFGPYKVYKKKIKLYPDDSYLFIRIHGNRIYIE